ncbi:MAG: hypothetical protein HY996_07510, partial [Micrococcales bacterium]|nr:hypothetical protein [Micrococcales bacterium]
RVPGGRAAVQSRQRTDLAVSAIDPGTLGLLVDRIREALQPPVAA